MDPQIVNPENVDSELLEPAEPAKLDAELHLFECGVCGYVYEPALGDRKHEIPEGTAFDHLPSDWKCPVCTARKNKFSDIGVKNKPSGFTENLGYGLGVNVLTPGQKNILIFGGLAVAFLIFMSLYALD